MATAGGADVSQYLTFTLDDELFAVDIAKVREVLEFTSTTKVPKVPDYMRGVINLRGAVVPVMDLRIKFGMSQTEKSLNTCVIITEMMIDGETTVLGALADSVQEVIDLDGALVEPPPKIGTRLKTEFITGMGRRDDAFVILLDIDKVFGDTELAAIGELIRDQSGAAAEAAAC